MKLLHRVLAVLLCCPSSLILAFAGSVIEVRPDSPIIQQPDKQAAMVLVNTERKLEFADLPAQADRFVPAASIGLPNANYRYRITHRVVSRLPTDREIRLMPGGGRG
jgi:hypothetical protein